MKNSAGRGECYPPRPKAEVDNTLRDLQNSSYPTQPHSIIAKYCHTRFSQGKGYEKRCATSPRHIIQPSTEIRNQMKMDAKIK